MKTKKSFGPVKNFIVSFIASIVILVFLSACKRPNSCIHESIKVDMKAEDKSKIVYKDSTKLTFIRNSTKDTFVFVGQGYQSGYIDYHNAQSECYTNYQLEYKSLRFTCNSFPQPIDVSVYYYVPDVKFFVIEFNHTIYSTSPADLGKPFTSDSLTIQSNKYYNIIYFKDEYEIQQNDAYGCFYSLKSGILKMETNDNDTWEIIKIE